VTSERQPSSLEPPAPEIFDDDVTWHGLVERAMRTARLGAPDPAAHRRLVEVVSGASDFGFDHALLAATSAEAHAYVMAFLTSWRSPNMV
jgi:hypothetical protein